ncbi:SpoIIE family protein phosphatase [Bacteroidota bacterium]
MVFKRTQSFAFRISMFILLFVSALIAAIFLYYYLFTKSIITESARSNANSIATNAVNKIEKVLIPVEKTIKGLALYIEEASPDEEKFKKYLSAMLLENPDIFGSAIAFEPYSFDKNSLYFSRYLFKENNAYSYSSLDGDEYKYFIQDWYLIPKMLDRPYWTEPYYDEGGGDILMSTYSVPIYKNINGEKIFDGIVTADIALNWLTELVDSIKIYESGYAFMVSRKGAFISHPNAELIMNESLFSISVEFNEPNIREIGRSMIDGQTALIDTNSEIFPKSWLFYTQLPENKWSIGVVFPENELFSGLKRITITIIILGFIGFILLYLIITKVARKVTVPLSRFADSAREIAGGKFDITLPEIKTKDEMGQLHQAFEYLQTELKEYISNLQKTTAAKEKIESELRIANEIQQGMIPKIFPPFPDRSDIDLFATLDPAKEVGGDLYDFFLSEDNKLVIVIGDVSGKGVPAALFMVVTRTLLRAIKFKGKTPEEIVFLLNNLLSRDNESQMFVTFFLGIVDLKKGEIEYVNAGHNPPVLIDNDNNVSFTEMTKDIVLGCIEDKPFHQKKIKINPGDKLFLYTDGVTEAENTEQQLYSDERLISLLKNTKEEMPDKIIEVVYNDIKSFAKGAEQSDDITMLAIKYHG